MRGQREREIELRATGKGNKSRGRDRERDIEAGDDDGGGLRDPSHRCLFPSPSEREVHRRTPARVLCPPSVRQGGGTRRPQKQNRNVSAVTAALTHSMISVETKPKLQKNVLNECDDLMPP